jgi:hypothetical protein
LGAGRIIIGAIERCVRNIAEDVYDIHETVNENGKRLLSLDTLSREHNEDTKRWRADTEVKIQATQDVVLSIKNDIKRTKTGTVLLNQNLDIRVFYIIMH